MKREGEVEEVLIGGTDDYSSGDWVLADTDVLVRYHDFEESSTEDFLTNGTVKVDSRMDDSEIQDSRTFNSASNNPNDSTINGSKAQNSDVASAVSAQTASLTPSFITPEKAFFEVHYIDVGQADSARVLCDGAAMLIDGGNTEDSNLIYTYLKNLSVEHLDYIVCTHGYEDHVGGLAGALNYATVDHALCPMTSYDSKVFGNFVKYLDRQGVSIEIPICGDTFTLGSSTVQVVGPICPSDEPNNTSIVLRIVYGETSFLFTGDAEREEEQDILNAGYVLDSTVLKVGHHGSVDSTTYPFLREIMPEYAVISVGNNNFYGHPTEEALSRLRDADVKVYRTDLQGDVVCTSDGKTVTFSVDRNADADTLAAVGPNSTQLGGNSGSGDSGNQPRGSLAPANPLQENQQEQTTSNPAPAGTDYVLNTNTYKFHYPSCSSAKQMSEKNKRFYTGTREEIIAMGYDPCKRCNP